MAFSDYDISPQPTFTQHSEGPLTNASVSAQMFTTKEKLNARGQTAEVPQRHGYTANYQSGVLMNATHGKEKKPNTKGHKYCASPPRENPEQARPQNQKNKKIRRGLGARDRVLLLIGNMSSGLGQTAF